MLRIYLVSKFQQGRSSRVGGIVSPQFDLYRNPGTVLTFNDRVNLQSGAVSIVSHSGPDRLRIYPQVPNHHRFEQETEGSQVAPEPLGVSVKSCRCQRGIHQVALGGLSNEGPRAKPCRPRRLVLNHEHPPKRVEVRCDRTRIKWILTSGVAREGALRCFGGYIPGEGS